jgi:chitodextrinase
MKKITQIIIVLFSLTVMAQVPVTQQQLFLVGIGETPTPPAVDTESPTAPTNILVSNITTNQITINFTSSTDNVGVTQYLLYNGGNVLVQTFTGTDTDITALSPETTYTGYYIRARDAIGNLSVPSNTFSFTTATEVIVEGTNMIDEEAYFNAYLVPQAEAANLQTYINTYNHVRLEAGYYGFDQNYGGITLSSNQSIYGHPSINIMPNITIAAGSTNVHIENIQPLFIDFNAGAPITNSLFKTIKSATLRSTGGMIENNLFLNLNSAMYFDMSASGYYRNNRIIRHQTHGPIALHLQGNNTTPSYGNVNVWSNYLTPIAEGAILEDMGDFTFIGLDSEGWNFREEQTFGAMFYASGMGNLKMTDFIGGANYSTDGQPAWLIEADNLLFFGKTIWSQSPTVENTALSGTDVFAVADTGSYNVVSGTDARAFTSNSSTYDINSFYYGGVKQTAPMTNATAINNIKDIILDTPYTPYPKEVHETLPDPLGANWANERLGKPDNRAYIQGLIDANNIADLPEGIFYISSTLFINGDDNKKQGIIGKGTGKTVICGLTDDFPLITVTKTDNSQAAINLAYLTLQGGSKGLYFPTNLYLIAFNYWKYVVFRNQSIGIHVDKVFGLDNNNFDHLSFVNCGTGFLNDYQVSPGTSDPVAYQTWLENDLGYVDKTVFYKSQFINCDVGCQVNSFRASNLNLWQDCLFDGNRLAANVIGNRHSMFVNSVFRNNSGGSTTEFDAVIACGDLSLYSCDFNNNTSANVLRSGKIYMEGCNLLDNIPYNNWAFDQTNYIYNSVINGEFRGGWLENKGVYVNSTFAQRPELNKLLLIEYDDPNTGRSDNDILEVKIDEPSNPYPQFYVTNNKYDTVSPSTPTTLAVSGITATTVNLTWVASTDNVAIKGYKIYNNGVLLANLYNTATSYTLTNLAQGTAYNLTIKGVDTSNNESSSSNAVAFTTDAGDVVAPTNPSTLATSNVTATTVNLTWTGSTDDTAVTSYRIYNNDVLLINTGSTSTSFKLESLTPATTYNLTIRAIDAIGNESGNSNLQTITTNAFSADLLASWELSANGLDASGNGYELTLFNSPTFTTEDARPCIQLNGTNQYAAVVSGLVNGLNEFTVMGWSKLDPTAFNEDRPILATHTGLFNQSVDDAPAAISLRYDTAGILTGQPKVMKGQTYGIPAFETTATTYIDNTWYHWALVFDTGVGMKLYKNGVEVALYTVTSKPTTMTIANQDIFSLGRGRGTSTLQYFKGWLSDFKVYSSAKDASFIIADKIATE